MGGEWYGVYSGLPSLVPIMTILASDSLPSRTGGLALVDYDNMCEYRRESKADIELGTERLVDTLVRSFRAAFPGLMELDVRFYGGWTDERGLPSPMALLLSGILPGLRGRRHGLIVRPSLAIAMVRFPDTILRGTARLSTKPRRQKMVDGMLGCDAIFIAATDPAPIGIVTDDDDLVPAALSAHAAGMKPMVWMRSRPVGQGLNDRSLSDRGLRIHPMEKSAND